MEKSNPLVSVIVPVYKVEKYLNRCVDSIINQTYKNLEIILVDDGSPDGCPAICDEYAKQDKRVKVIHKANGGLSDARNKGLDVAKGQYVMFIDSDDYVNTYMIDKMLCIASANDSDIVMCNYIRVTNIDSSEPKLKSDFTHYMYVYGRQEVFNVMYDKKINLPMIACCKLYKREIFNSLRFELNRYHEDEYMFHHVLSKCKNFVYINEQLYYYFYNSQSITKSIKEKNILDMIDAFNDRYSFMSRNYPEYSIKNDLHYLANLRAVCVCSRPFKKLYKDNLKRFNEFYSQGKQRDKKDWLFKYFRPVYFLLLKLRHKR